MTKDEEIDFLKERIAQLEELLAGASIIPIQFHLSVNQTKLFGLMLRRSTVMIRRFRRWFGLKCWLHLCGGKIGHTCDGGVCWCCAACGREIE